MALIALGVLFILALLTFAVWRNSQVAQSPSSSSREEAAQARPAGGAVQDEIACIDRLMQHGAPPGTDEAQAWENCKRVDLNSAGGSPVKTPE
jgi:predicted negative regulator of RcsB-dependent stress response